jgi:hypothetical protein
MIVMDKRMEDCFHLMVIRLDFAQKSTQILMDFPMPDDVHVYYDVIGEYSQYALLRVDSRNYLLAYSIFTLAGWGKVCFDLINGKENIYSIRWHQTDYILEPAFPCYFSGSKLSIFGIHTSTNQKRMCIIDTETNTVVYQSPTVNVEKVNFV